MDIANDTELEHERLLPKSQSNTSIMMNGAGNGMMLGAIPFLALELRSVLTGKNQTLTKNQKVASIAITGAGAVIGVIYGASEARHLEEYRNAVSAELKNLRTQLKSQAKVIDSWKARIEAEPTSESSQGRA